VKNKKSLIIAIAAVSGGGKTTVTTRLNQLLPKSKALFFDDYDFEGPDDIPEWVERGGDCNEWKLMPLVSDINSLTSPISSEIDFILLDYPFANSHNEMKGYIDLTVFIDTPLDIAMARRIMRDFSKASSEQIHNELAHYLSRGRDAYLNMLNTTKPNSELIIDGSLSVDEIVNQICSILKK
jgi:uridine kinase